MAAHEMTETEAPDFSVSSEHAGHEVVVSVAGEIDIASVLTIQHHLDRAESAGANPLVLDLADVTFMDSTGVAMLMDAHRRAVAAGRRFVVRGVTAQPRRVLQIVGVCGMLAIEP